MAQEGPQVIQAVAGCPGVSPVRLTAAVQSLPGLGPDNKPPSLYEVSPLTAVEPERIVNKIHRQDYAPTHPILLLLGILAMLPLGALALQTFRRAQKLRGKTVLEGVIEQSDAGALTIRSGERHVTVFVEEGERSRSDWLVMSYKAAAWRLKVYMQPWVATWKCKKTQPSVAARPCACAPVRC